MQIAIIKTNNTPQKHYQKNLKITWQNFPFEDLGEEKVEQNAESRSVSGIFPRVS